MLSSNKTSKALQQMVLSIHLFYSRPNLVLTKRPLSCLTVNPGFHKPPLADQFYIFSYIDVRREIWTGRTKTPLLWTEYLRWDPLFTIHEVPWPRCQNQKKKALLWKMNQRDLQNMKSTNGLSRTKIRTVRPYLVIEHTTMRCHSLLHLKFFEHL